MSVPKGSVIVAGGNGKVMVVSPTADNQVLVLDSAQPAGVAFVDIKGILPSQRLKASVASTNSTTNSTYTKISEISVPGQTTNPITSITVIAYMDNGVTSYDVRAVAASTGLVVATGTFTNTTPQIQNLGTLSNLPPLEGILEFHIRKNGGNSQKYVYLTEANVVIDP
jgi:hypothetical protein